MDLRIHSLPPQMPLLIKTKMGIIDFHAHIIPRADHGSSSVEVSLCQLKSAVKNGVSRIIATPHFYPHEEDVPSFIKKRNACYEKLENYLNDELPEIRLGAEVLICDNIEEMPGLEQLCISGTKIILLELPFTDFSDSYVSSVKAMIKQEYIVVIAHADRYDPRNIERLLSAGAQIQLNAYAISGLFVPRHIRKWLKDDRVYAIGSDIHGSNKYAYARFARAIRKIGKAVINIKAKSDSAWC